MEVDPKLKSAVEKLKSGNDEAFNEVYQKTYNYVYFRARQIMNNEEDALDLMQTVYMEAYKSIAGLDKVESIYSWLSSITFRQGMRIFQKKREILLDEDFENVFDSIESSDMDSRPELSYERKEQQRILAELIDSLPEVQRATMVAFYYDNIKIEEIAEVMDCSVGTVKSRLSYARQALKKKLGAIEKKSGKSGAGKMVLSGTLIFGAVQILSEETVLAAPLAAGVFGNICSGLGIAATGAAVAGTALAGGTGVSAAAGTAAGTALAGGAGMSAAAGTAAGTALAGGAGVSAAAGTAAGTALAGGAGMSAAAGTAAGTALAGGAGISAATGTAAGAAAAGAGAAAGTAAAGAGAAKGIAVAVAVAVAGTGGTVGTTIYRNTVSSIDKVSANEEESSFDGMDILSENAYYDEDDRDIPEDTEPSETEGGSVNDKSEEASENGEVETGAADVTETAAETTPTIEAPAENKETHTEIVKEEAQSDEDGKYGMTDRLKKHIASAVASLFMTGSGNLYTGEVNNDTLEAAYLLENSLFKTKKEIKAISGNSVFISSPGVLSASKEGEVITVEGSFDVGRSDETGNISYDNYLFVLHGVRSEEEGLFGHFVSKDLSITGMDSLDKTEPKKEHPDNKDAAGVSGNAVNTGNEALPTESFEIITESTEAHIPEISEIESGISEAENQGGTVSESAVSNFFVDGGF